MQNAYYSGGRHARKKRAMREETALGKPSIFSRKKTRNRPKNRLPTQIGAKKRETPLPGASLSTFLWARTCSGRFWGPAWGPKVDPLARLSADFRGFLGRLWGHLWILAARGAPGGSRDHFGTPQEPSREGFWRDFRPQVDPNLSDVCPEVGPNSGSVRSPRSWCLWLSGP